MKALLVALLLALAAAAGLTALQKTVQVSGVIYQNEDDFVIAETDNMKPIATLQAVEFATEHFANFVGKTVKVRGTMVTAGLKKVLRVQKLADVEETPAPKQP